LELGIEIEEVCFDLGQISLHGLACGDDDADVVLCLHGWLDNVASFIPLMPILAKKLPNKRIIAIDWPGHGFSSHRSADAYYHFVDWTYDLLQLFDANNWQSIDIVGHSMGGMVATAFSAAFPEKVHSLTLIDSIGFISSKAEQTTSQLRDGMLSRLRSVTKNKNIHPSIDSAVKARVSVSDMNYQNAKTLVKRGLAKKDNGYVWRSDSRLRMTSPYRLTLAQAEQFIRDVKIPVQLIHGEKGMDMVTSGIKHFSPLFKNFKCVEINGGHHCHMEAPEITGELIYSFLEQG